MRLVAASLFIFALALQAGSLPYAYGGVVNAPEAYVLEHTEVEVGIAASAYSFEDSTGASESDIKFTGFINLGILSYGEIGAAYLADGGVVVNAKVAILKEGITVPAFSLGCRTPLPRKRSTASQALREHRMKRGTSIPSGTKTATTTTPTHRTGPYTGWVRRTSATSSEPP